MNINTKHCYTIGQVAAMYGVGRYTVSMWISRGHLTPSFEWGGRYGVTEADLDAFEARRKAMRGKGSAHPARRLARTRPKKLQEK